LGAIIAFTFYMQKENEKAEQEKTIGIEAQDVKRRYLEKRLEIIKQETIAAENSNISSEARKSNVNEPAKQVQQRGPKIYSWINEKGQKVYSNRPQEP
jgi:phage-related minor tail protein